VVVDTTRNQTLVPESVQVRQNGAQVYLKFLATEIVAGGSLDVVILEVFSLDGSSADQHFIKVRSPPLF